MDVDAERLGTAGALLEFRGVLEDAMMTTAEAYAKLKPPKPTPPVELCKCGSSPAIKLAAAPGFNPLRCVTCSLEVSPEGLQLPAELAESVANWNAPAEGIYRLWLAQGEYEQWALRQLTDLNSPLNVDGRHLAEALNAVRRCYFWCFAGEEGLTQCPRCGGEVTTLPSRPSPQAYCDDCSLIGPGPQ